MGITVQQALAKLGAMLDIDVQQGEYPVYALGWLNDGARRVWEARGWFGRDTEATLFMLPTYTTGTLTFTQDSTAVTGSGTTWTSAMSGRKIALGIGQPWYRFTRTGNTTGTIPTGGYVEATATASAYVIFQDEYDLPSTAETILDVELYSGVYRGHLGMVTEAKMDAEWFVNPTSGIPMVWAPVLAQTAGIRRMRFSPVPTSASRVRVHYLAAYTPLVAPSDSCILSDNCERAWILASALEAQRGGDARQVTSEAEVQAAIEEAWVKTQPSSPLSVRKVPVGGGISGGQFVVDYTNATP